MQGKTNPGRAAAIEGGMWSEKREEPQIPLSLLTKAVRSPNPKAPRAPLERNGDHTYMQAIGSSLALNGRRTAQ